MNVHIVNASSAEAAGEEAAARGPGPRPRRSTISRSTTFCSAPQTVHRRTLRRRTRCSSRRLLSIKTGGCAEDCGYCSQSAHHASGLKASKLMEVERVISEAQEGQGSGRDAVLHGCRVALAQGARHGVGRRHGRGRESARHGNLHDARHADDDDVVKLKDAGLDYYNHNIDTSERYSIESSRRARSRIASIRSSACATPA